jgi:tetratricopeptide (TPR) repeat protein
LSKAINGTLVKPALEKAQSLQPNSTAVLFGFGSYYLLAPRIAGGDLEKAEEYLKRTVAADPLFADAYVRLSQLYNIKGDKEKQDYYFNKAQVIDPRNEFIFDVKSKMCKFICIEKQE